MNEHRSVPSVVRIVGVCDPWPLFRVGLVDVLRRAGYQADQVEDPVSWHPDGDPYAIVLAATRVGRPISQTISLLHERWPKAVIATVLPEITPPGLGAMLSQGADLVVGRHETPERIVEMLHAASQGCVVLPLRIARTMAQQAAKLSPVPDLAANELSWLKMLAEGRSVTDVARSAGYSRRQMHRELSGLYARLGAAHRAEALVQAARSGLL